MSVIISENKSKQNDKSSDDYYFDSYSSFAIHDEMINDTVRTRAYKDAIQRNSHLFKDKIVMDIGCGTGILSLFAAQAGAKHVYGIEMSEIGEYAKKIVEENKMSDKVTIVRGKVEEITLPVKQVDIIISEWIGYFLIYESMLDTVLFARDKWLAKDGLLFPNKSTIYLTSISDGSFRKDQIDFWDNVYGFDMSCMKKHVLLEPLVEMCDGKTVLSTSEAILDFDINEVKKEELDFSKEFKLKCTRKDTLHALVGYFDCFFDYPQSKHKVVLPTGPKDKYTHWKQTIFHLDEPVEVDKDDTIAGDIFVRRNKINPRDLDITLNVRIRNGPTKKYEYKLR